MGLVVVQRVACGMVLGIAEVGEVTALLEDLDKVFPAHLLQ